MKEKTDVDMTDTCRKIQKKLNIATKKIYGNLSPWQKVQMSRHPDRPYTLDYINSIFILFQKIVNEFIIYNLTNNIIEGFHAGSNYGSRCCWRLFWFSFIQK